MTNQEIDRLMAEAQGWKVCDGYYRAPVQYGYNTIHFKHFKPSTDIKLAVEALEELEKDPREILPSMTKKGSSMMQLRWDVRLRECRGKQTEYYADAETLSLAICLAILKARGVEPTRHVKGEGGEDGVHAH